jgi:hypothetical protein
MKKNDLKSYDDFFLELPPTDYLQDIEIQDDYEKNTDYTIRGLSAEQVSQIAADSLEEASQRNPEHEHNPDPPSPE